MTTASALWPYYLKALRHLLSRKARTAAFLAASVMHALGHALMALLASALAMSLTGRLSIQNGAGRAEGLGRTLCGNYACDNAFLFSSLGLAVVVIKVGAGALATYAQVRAAAEVGCELRLELLDALLSRYRLRQARHLDHGFEPPPAARAVSALTERVREVEAGVAWGLLSGLRAAAQLLLLAISLVVLSPRMAAVAVAVLGGFSWLLGRVRGGYRNATSCAAREQELLLEAADDCVRHADLWISFGAEATARERVRALGQRIAEGGARLRARAVVLSGSNEILGAGALVAAIVAARLGALGSVGNGSTVLAFAIPFFLAYRPLRELSDARLVFARAEMAYAELKHVVDSAGGANDVVAPVMPRAWPLGVLELRGLRLRRGACGPITMRVEPGTVAVVVGPTAVGKTTLLRTLLGLEPSAGGEILFDGVALGDAPAGPSERPFVWVPQDAPLLADTLAANVSLGAPRDVALDALKPLGAGHLAESLRDEKLGAGGRAVSGGERQWIALARAVATRLPVMVLDEPTSGLDSDAQRVVLRAIAGLRGRRTVVLVTHRPEPIAIADTVLRLDAIGLDLTGRPAA